MGASPTDDGTPVPAAVMSTQPPEVSVEESADGEARVLVEGTMYHDGLNANAWGLSEAGATAIADDLVGREYTAAHPHIRGTKYDRSVADGPGAPIGEVLSTNVVSVDGATVDGGGYTAAYTAEVKDPRFAENLSNGLRVGGNWGVSIGIYADPESASCSVCGDRMASESCEHRRGEEVKIESEDGEVVDTQVAGPIYDGGDADHLAHVWMPAYEGATAEVDTASQAPGVDEPAYTQTPDAGARMVQTASRVLAEPFDEVASATAASDPADATPPADDDQTTRDGYPVAVSSATAAKRALRRRERGSYEVKINNG